MEPRFEELFKKNHKRLCQLAFRMVNDQDAAKDIVQEVFVKLWNNKDKVEWTSEIDNYLFKATTNTSLNYLRSVKKMIRIESATDMDDLQASTHHDVKTLSELESKVANAINRLPPKCKAIYLLSRDEGMKYQQIADTLDISVKTVENQMMIALQKLRTDLKPFLITGFGLIGVLLGLVWLILK